MDDWQPKTELNVDEKRSFEKARLEYCSKLYNREMQRKDLLEKKAQFYLSLLTLFTGALFFKLDFFQSLQKIISNHTVPQILVRVLYTSIPLVGISILVALIAILQSIKIKTYQDPSPKKVLDEWFRKPTLTYEDELYWLRDISLRYAVAWEANHKVNNKKARWINIASYSVIFSVIFVAVFLGISSYLFIYFPET